MWNYCSSIKAFFILFFIFFLSSCDQPETKEVTSGTAQIQTAIFSKSCDTGSFKVLQKTRVALDADGQPVVSSVSASGLNQLKGGDRVSITGRISNASPCYQGVASFTCEAQVFIEQNRSFICETGSVSGSSPVSALGTGSSPSAKRKRAFLKGDFHTFGNGQQAFGRMVVGSSSNLAPQASCVISFFCL